MHSKHDCCFVVAAEERYSLDRDLQLADLRCDAAAAEKEGFVDARSVFKSPGKDVVPPSAACVYLQPMMTFGSGNYVDFVLCVQRAQQSSGAVAAGAHERARSEDEADAQHSGHGQLQPRALLGRTS